MNQITDCQICQIPITHVGKGHGIKKQNYGYCHDRCVDWIRKMVDGIFINGHYMTHKGFLEIWDKLELPRNSIYARSQLLKQ